MSVRLTLAPALVGSVMVEAGDASQRVRMDSLAREVGMRASDAAHFSREYKRLFGMPPLRDVGRLREVIEASSG